MGKMVTRLIRAREVVDLVRSKKGRCSASDVAYHLCLSLEDAKRILSTFTKMEFLAISGHKGVWNEKLYKLGRMEWDAGDQLFDVSKGSEKIDTKSEPVDPLDLLKGVKVPFMLPSGKLIDLNGDLSDCSISAHSLFGPSGGLDDVVRYNGRIGFSSVRSHSIGTGVIAAVLIDQNFEIRDAIDQANPASRAFLLGLLHDVHEALIGDIIGPTKQIIDVLTGGAWAIWEDQIRHRVIAKIMGFDPFEDPDYADELEIVKKADKIAMSLEVAASKVPVQTWPCPIPHEIVSWAHTRRDTEVSIADTLARWPRFKNPNSPLERSPWIACPSQYLQEIASWRHDENSI